MYKIPVQWKDKKALGQFMVCEHLDLDLIGIDLINELGISYDARAQQVFSISKEDNVLVSTGEVELPGLQTSVITAWISGHITAYKTPVVTIAPPQHPHLTGLQQRQSL